EAALRVGRLQTPPGEVYATEEFAAPAARPRDHGLRLTAAGGGPLPLYHVDEAPAAETTSAVASNEHEPIAQTAVVEPPPALVEAAAFAEQLARHDPGNRQYQNRLAFVRKKLAAGGSASVADASAAAPAPSAARPGTAEVPGGSVERLHYSVTAPAAIEPGSA